MPPYPKQKRIVDKELVAKIRAKGYCMMSGKGECWGGLDVHHIRTRGSGGDDVEDNLILLCRNHHNLAGTHFITRAELYAAIRRDKLLHLHDFRL